VGLTIAGREAKKKSCSFGNRGSIKEGAHFFGRMGKTYHPVVRGARFKPEQIGGITAREKKNRGGK